jgi:hypothetical protein
MLLEEQFRQFKGQLITQERLFAAGMSVFEQLTHR